MHNIQQEIIKRINMMKALYLLQLLYIHAIKDKKTKITTTENSEPTNIINNNQAEGLKATNCPLLTTHSAQAARDNEIEMQFVYGTKINVPEYIIKGNKKYRVISDHLGSVRKVIDSETGEILQEMDYDSFGNVIRDTNQGFQPFGFAGGIYDTDTGLVRFGARDYDASIGRWTAKDPILFYSGSINLFNYCGNDPVNFVDMSGRIKFKAVKDAFVEQNKETLVKMFAKASHGKREIEIAAWVVDNNGKLEFVYWPEDNVKGYAKWPDDKPVPKNLVAQVHTHPLKVNNNHRLQFPSGKDPCLAEKYAIPVYVLARRGISKYEPSYYDNNGKVDGVINDIIGFGRGGWWN